jgi:hypothetical protein
VELQLKRYRLTSWNNSKTIAAPGAKFRSGASLTQEQSERGAFYSFLREIQSNENCMMARGHSAASTVSFAFLSRKVVRASRSIGQDVRAPFLKKTFRSGMFSIAALRFIN